MGFYGNITNVNKSTFQFDKIYHNRSEMTDGANSDGIFVGRYVLVDYDIGSDLAGAVIAIADEYGIDINNTNYKLGYSRKLWEVPPGSSSTQENYINETDDEYHQPIIQANFETSNLENAYFYVVEGQDHIRINGKNYTNVIQVPNQSFIIVMNAIQDKRTVITINGNEVIHDEYKDFVNSLLDGPEIYYFTAEEVDKLVYDENGELVYKPQLDENGNPVYELDENNNEVIVYTNEPLTDGTTFRTHIETITEAITKSDIYKNAYLCNYRFDVERFGNIGRGWDSTVWQKVYRDGQYAYVMIAELNSIVPTFDITVDAPTETPLKPHYDSDNSNLYYKLHFQPSWGMRIKAAGGEFGSGIYSLDSEIYPSDIKGKFVIDSQVESQSNENGVNHHIIKKEVDNRNLAIYFDSKSFSKYWDSEVETFRDGETPVEDRIDITPTGYSGNKYYGHDTLENGTPVENGSETLPRKYPDTYELSVMLPSIGQSISQMWDVVYGKGIQLDNYGDYLWDKDHATRFADEETLIRNTDTKWNSSAGLRATEYGNHNEYVLSTLAGTINSAHDLMGMIIRSGSLSDAANWDPTKIYYINGKFYRKAKKYTYPDTINTTALLANYLNESEFTPVSVTNVTSGNYYRVDLNQLPMYEEADGLTSSQIDALLNQPYYNNYIKVNANDIVYDGAKYGTINDTNRQAVVLASENYLKNSLYSKSEDTNGAPIYTLSTSDFPSSSKYYRIGEIEQISSEEKFYHKDTYYIGLIYNADSNWEKEEWSASDFDAIRLCTEDTYQEIKTNYPDSGTTRYKIFENVAIDIVDTDILIEDKEHPVLKRQYGVQYNETNGVKTLTLKPSTEGSNWSFVYTYNDSTNTWDYSFPYSVDDITVDEETIISFIKFDLNGTDVFTEQIPDEYLIREINEQNQENIIGIKLFSYSCYESPSVLIGYSLFDIVEGAYNETVYHINFNLDNEENIAFKVIYPLIREKTISYNFDQATPVELKDFDVSENYYYLTSLSYQDDVGLVPYEDETGAVHYYQWAKETEDGLATDQGKGRLSRNEYYKFTPSVPEETDTYYLLNDAYYFEKDDNYLRDIATRISPLSTKEYFKVSESPDGQSTVIFTAINNEPFVANKYYYQPVANGPFVLAKDYINNATYYKKDKALYVKSTTTDLVQVGAEWNKQVTELPAGVVLSHRNESWGYEEIKEYKDFYNTLNGLILGINNILLPNDVLTRDLNTVQGSINTLNDIINKFDELVPTEIVMIDEYGRVHSADKDSEQSVTAINYGIADAETDSGFAAGVVEDIEDKTEDGKNANDERWIKLTTTDGDSPDYKPHIKLEHTLNHKVTPTVTAADKNTPYTDLTLPQGNNGLGLNNSSDDTLKLYTPIVDNMGHIVGNNTETVTLPYGFKTINIGDESEDTNHTETGNDPAAGDTIDNLALSGVLTADNTQDELTINPSNKWIRIKGTDTSADGELIRIGHEIHYIDESSNNFTDFNNANTQELPRNTDIINIPDWDYDNAGHIIEKHNHEYVLPYGYKTIMVNNSTDTSSPASIVAANGQSADNSQDTLTFSTSNKWIKLDNNTDDTIKIGHETHEVTQTPEAAVNLNEHEDNSTIVNAVNTINIPVIDQDAAGHITKNALKQYTLPHNFSKITVDTGADPAPEIAASGVNDVLKFNKDAWTTLSVATTSGIKTITIGHDSPVSSGQGTDATTGSPTSGNNSFSNTFNIPYITYDSKGHIISTANNTVTLSVNNTPTTTLSTVTGLYSGLAWDTSTIGKLNPIIATTNNFILDNNYTINNITGAVAATDSLNTAFAKLQVAINTLNANANTTGSVDKKISDALNTLRTEISAGYIDPAELDNAIAHLRDTTGNYWGAQFRSTSSEFKQTFTNGTNITKDTDTTIPVQIPLNNVAATYRMGNIPKYNYHEYLKVENEITTQDVDGGIELLEPGIYRIHGGVNLKGASNLRTLVVEIYKVSAANAIDNSGETPISLPFSTIYAQNNAELIAKEMDVITAAVPNTNSASNYFEPVETSDKLVELAAGDIVYLTARAIYTNAGTGDSNKLTYGANDPNTYLMIERVEAPTATN